MAHGITLLLIILLVLVLAAAGWGPGTHIQFTLEILHRLGRKRAVTHAQNLVLCHPQPFLYGNIAADIINFKAFGGMKNHCHNWNIEERLAAHARDDASLAFILGYLCHLAADVVAHNHFVPYHCVYDFPPRLLGHAYWEAMADSGVSDHEWHAIDNLKRQKTIHAFDRMVHRAVERRALGLRSNKWIFNNILLINCRSRWREVIRRVEAGPRRHNLDEQFLRVCRAHSLRNMLWVFYPRRLAILKAYDPTGKAALQGALRIRRELLRDFTNRSHAREVARQAAVTAFGRVP